MLTLYAVAINNQGLQLFFLGGAPKLQQLRPLDVSPDNVSWLNVGFSVIST